MKALAKIQVKGVVQGVGFRPFIHRLAKTYRLRGYVLNDPAGVEMEVEGERACIEKFYAQMLETLPPLARIEHREISFGKPKGYTAFKIRRSAKKEGRRVLLPPDVGTCNECLLEVMDPSDRRYRYPFTNCTNCGPRFSIIEDVPYDRSRTSMRSFRMCPRCNAEYEDIENRRYHAEPNACPECGPKLSLVDSSGRTIPAEDILSRVAGFLREGRIVGVKGIGGFHLACDASNDSVVKELRRRKAREGKPFAVMMRDLETVRRHCYVEEAEEALLASSAKPILLLRKKEPDTLAPSLAPGNRSLGVMLPYTPLHYLLMQEAPEAIVLTSGNFTDEPIATTNDYALKRLKSIADCFLLHDREIVNRSDDSVVALFEGKSLMIRRSRGYAPLPVGLAFESPPLLAVGGELKNTFCLLRGREAFLSQHIGDLKDIRTDEFFIESLKNYLRMFGLEPMVIAHDRHPNYLSTVVAQEFGQQWSSRAQLVSVQHHHAHIAACMAEMQIEGEVIGLSYDGTGYGTDGAVWGGEVLRATYEDFRRMFHLRYVGLPGGDKAADEPWRMAASHLFDAFGKACLDLKIPFLERIGRRRLKDLFLIIEKKINTPDTSSVGRLFDAVSSLLGLADKNTFEAEAAMLLEHKAEEAPGSYPFEISGDEIDTRPLIRSVVEDILGGVPAEIISTKFHRAVAGFSVLVCRRMREETGLSRVVLSGGCFQNRLLLKMLVPALRNGGFEVFYPQQVPANDGGLSLGQAAVAANVIRGR